ncbi:hypothetical protein COO60DRAFT_1634871 [Scenedesmus sp. NREL 46B-D3]|nr:hypothetical protein COO60DRAFT_1634871 [Scenedesmus sp. NREL 46B-D3]
MYRWGVDLAAAAVPTAVTASPVVSLEVPVAPAAAAAAAVLGPVLGMQPHQQQPQQPACVTAVGYGFPSAVVPTTAGSEMALTLLQQQQSFAQMQQMLMMQGVQLQQQQQQQQLSAQQQQFSAQQQPSHLVAENKQLRHQRDTALLEVKALRQQLTQQEAELEEVAIPESTRYRAVMEVVAAAMCRDFDVIDAFSLPQDIRQLDIKALIAARAAVPKHPWLAVAGWPCQDLSAAGAGAGLQGEETS